MNSSRGLAPRDERAAAYIRRTIESILIPSAPKWLSPAYWLCLAFSVAGTIAIGFGSVPEISSEQGVLWITDHLKFVAVRDEIAAEVHVTRGQRVNLDQVLVVLRPVRASSIATEPASAGSSNAETESVLKALASGTILDVNVNTGQVVDSGDVILSVAYDAPMTMVAGSFPRWSGPKRDRAPAVRFEPTETSEARFPFSAATVVSSDAAAPRPAVEAGRHPAASTPGLASGVVVFVIREPTVSPFGLRTPAIVVPGRLTVRTDGRRISELVFPALQGRRGRSE